jgi:hypothetical protein
MLADGIGRSAILSDEKVGKARLSASISKNNVASSCHFLHQGALATSGRQTRAGSTHTGTAASSDAPLDWVSSAWFHNTVREGAVTSTT